MTSCEINNFSIKYDEKMFEGTYPLIPNIIKKGRESTFYLRSNAPLSSEQLTNQKIVVSYYDEEFAKEENIEIPLTA